MTREPSSAPSKPVKSQRALHKESRLKAALKANMAKRKAQVRARSDGTTAGENGDDNNKA